MSTPRGIDPLVGQTIDGRYRIIDRLGQGGMGTVYRCENVRLHGRPCAMKVLSGLGTPRERARFEREIRTVSQLRSVHTVLVFDSGRLRDERPYIVMELLEGHELEALLAGEGALPVERAVSIAEQALTALIEAHALGIVHRDLKPANLFLVVEQGAEIVKVLDFGIAKQTHDAGPSLTRRDTSMGTPRYMSPEQFRNEDTHPSSDLYALGIVFYEMVVGRLPFHEDDPVPEALGSMPPGARLAWMHLNREVPEVAGLSPPLAEWLRRMLRKDPAERFPDAAAAREALRAVPEAGWTPSGRVTGRPSFVTPLDGPPPPPRSRRRTWLAGLAGGLLALGLLVAALELTRSPPCVHRLVTEPPGARAWVDGRLVGETPTDVERPCDEPVAVQLELAGHAPHTVELSGPPGETPTIYLLRGADEALTDPGGTSSLDEMAPDTMAPDAIPPDSIPPDAMLPDASRRRRRGGRQGPIAPPPPPPPPREPEPSDEASGPLLFD